MSQSFAQMVALARAHLGHFQQRARLGVALREQQEVVGLLLWQHDEVRLRTTRDTRPLVAP